MFLFLLQLYIFSATFYFNHAIISREAADGIAQYRLFNSLFQYYNRKLRPISNTNITTLIKMSPTLYSLERIDEAEETISISYWLRLEWHDQFLTWDPQAYDGIAELQVPFGDIWMPDVIVLETLDIDLVADGDNRAHVYYNGTIVAINPVVLKTSCNFDVQYFPYDVQNCSYTFCSFAYTGHEIRLESVGDGADLTSFQSDPQWTLLSFKSQRVQYNGFTAIEYSLVIKRRPLYFIFALIIPCAIITDVAILGLFGPSHSTGEREERITLGLTTLMTMAVLLLMVSSSMPHTSESVPLISAYISSQFLLASLASIVSVTIMHMQQRSLHGKPISPWMKSFVIGTEQKTVKPDPAEMKPTLEGKQNVVDPHMELMRQTVQNVADQLENLRREKALHTEWAIVCNKLDNFAGALFLCISTVILLVTVLFGM